MHLLTWHQHMSRTSAHVRLPVAVSSVVSVVLSFTVGVEGGRETGKIQQSAESLS